MYTFDSNKNKENITMSNDRPIPNAKERKELKNVLVEITRSLRKMDDERQQIKDILQAAHEATGIKPKLIRKLASVMYKHSYKDVIEENEHFEHLYEVLVENKQVEADAE